MNKLITIIGISIILAVSPVGFTGCATSGNQQAVAFQTLKSVQIAVDSAMKTYAVAAVTGKVSEDKQRQIDFFHAEYRKSFALAAGLVQNDLSKIAPEEVVEMATQLLVLISQL